MRKLPDLDNVIAMSALGRRSALMSAKNEACAGLRDCVTHINNGDLLERGDKIRMAQEWLSRLLEISSLMNQDNEKRSAFHGPGTHRVASKTGIVFDDMASDISYE